MKIRTGFVSNSSSTSYIVLLPNDFDPDAFIYGNLDKVEKAMQDYDGDFDDGRFGEDEGQDATDIDNLIQFLRKRVKPGARIYEDDGNETYYALEGLFHDLIISSVENGGDGEGSMTFVGEDKIFKSLNNYRNNIPSVEKVNRIKKEIEQKLEREKIEREEVLKKATSRKGGGNNWWEKRDESINIKKFKEL